MVERARLEYVGMKLLPGLGKGRGCVFPSVAEAIFAPVGVSTVGVVFGCLVGMGLRMLETSIFGLFAVVTLSICVG